jgi:hypothetical protein
MPYNFINKELTLIVISGENVAEPNQNCNDHRFEEKGELKTTVQ